MKLTTLGYYGFSNLGDEAVLAGIRSALATEKKFDGAELLVLSNSPEETTRLHPGVKAADRWSWKGAWDAMAGTDLFVFGGGSLLQDATSVKSVLWYFLMASLARKRAKKVLWWGQGIGPLNSSHSRRLTALLANRADAITVRDERSAELLKEIGARGSIQLVADPAFALEPVETRERVGTILALRHWVGNVTDWAVPAAAPQPRIWLPMHLPDDRNFLKPGVEVLDWKESGTTIAETMGRFAASELVIAMRLHALIFAARCGVPFVPISYDPKVDALAHAAGQQDVLLPTALVSNETMKQTVEKVMESAAARRERLQAFAAERRVAALLPARRAAELVA